VEDPGQEELRVQGEGGGQDQIEEGRAGLDFLLDVEDTSKQEGDLFFVSQVTLPKHIKTTFQLG
jgi:hypothetical protein